MAKPAPNWTASCASETGATAPAVAVILLVLFGFVALVVDTGAWYLSRRELQAAADAAALAAAPWAGDGRAQTEAQAALTANGVDPDVIPTLVSGVWCPSGSLGPTTRFRPGRLDCPDLPDATRSNAVRLTVSDQGPLIFAPLVATGMTPPNLNVRATAARINMAGLTAGSGVVEVNQTAGINAVLGALLGSSLNLSAVTYQQMLAAQVDALSLLDALNTRLNLNAGSYDQILNAQANAGQILDAAVGVLEQRGQTASISTGLAGAKVIRDLALQAPNKKIQIGKLLNVGVWKDIPVGQSSPTAATAGVDLLQLASTSLQVANGSNALSLAAPIDLGIVKVGLQTALIEPPQGSYFTFGPEGSRVHTAQARLQLNAQINLAPIVAANLPIYVEAGSGDAQITSIRCQGDPLRDTRVDVAARSSAIALHIGSPQSSLMNNFTQPVASTAITPAKIDVIQLAGLGLASVQVSGQAALTQQAQTLRFDQPTTPIITMPTTTPSSSGYIGRTAKTTSDASLATPARAGSGASLSAGSLSLKTCLFGQLLCTGSLNSEANARAALNTVFGLLNPLISGLLTGLGVHLGYVDVTVPGVRCGQAVLVE
ncbi:pilus assembly protein TadG-related protein [Caulobacter sp. 73W]|uniref:Pilus assembly protein TadG-related protein n=1 Tax=Caulobacter sp. 73W TaxID=3161137 RepID=A0AB39KNN1_9CAUL